MSMDIDYLEKMLVEEWMISYNFQFTDLPSAEIKGKEL
jgi:hypothetical protein